MKISALKISMPTKLNEAKIMYEISTYFETDPEFKRNEKKKQILRSTNVKSVSPTDNSWNISMKYFLFLSAIWLIKIN